MNTFQYNSTSINYYTTQDLGSIGDTPTSLVDDGTVYSELEPSADFIVTNDYIVSDYAIEPSYGFIVFTETTYPFGGLNISNATKVSASVKFVAAQPQIKLDGTYKVKLRSAWVGSGSLFEIAGGQERIVAPWVGSSGPLRVSGSAASSAVYQYNNSAIAVFSSGDYGSVSSTNNTSSNYGQITEVTSGEIDQGSIVITDITYPYGLFSFNGNFSNLTLAFGHQSSGIIGVSGSASVIFNEPTPQIYLVKTKDNIRVRGSANEAFVRKTYDGFINFGISDKANENVLFTYNEFSISYFNILDSGSITTSGSTIDYGYIINSGGSIIYGYTFNTQTIYPYGTLVSQGGFSNLLRSFGHQSQGSISLSGSAVTALQEPTPQIYKITSTDLFKISGTVQNKFSKAPYNGFGSLYSFTGSTENVTFDYNTSSVSVYSETNYGSLGSTTTTQDYGTVTQTNVGDINYGDVTSSQTNYAFGSLNINGSKTERFIYGKYSGSGNLFAFKGLSESKQSSYKSTYLFELRGTGHNSFTRPFIGFGSLFHVGDRIERATYAYNSSAIVEYSESDYGLVTTSGSTIDHGLINQVVNQGEINYGFINTGLTEYATNPLFTFTGNATVQYKPIFAQTGSGGFKVHHQPSPTDTRFIPWWRGYGEFIVSNRIIPDAFSRPYIGKGRLFSIGDKVESVTYDYNSTSIEYFNTENYGTITTSGTSVDLGHVNEDNTAVIDYSSIVNLDIVYPLNVLYNFSGEGIGQFIRGPYRGRGGIQFAGYHSIRQSDAWRGNLNVRITGSADEKNTEKYVGSGSLFHIGDRVEKATFSYNSSSVSDYDASDYGLITASGTPVDLGQITQSASGGEINYGNVIDLNITYPFGLFKVSGNSDDRWIQVFTKVGSGSLFEFNGATEAFSAQIPENTLLYSISGGGAVESKNNSYVGFGSLFHVGDRIERATFSYNTSSIVVYEPEVDYGLVTTSGSTIDYGLINQVTDGGEIDYGSVTLHDYDYPVNVLFKFGSAAFTELKPSFNFKGKGIINIQSDRTFVRFRPHWRSVGGLFVDGSANQSESKSYVASGSLFHIGDKVEKRTFSYNSSSVSDYDELDYGLITASGTPIDLGQITQSTFGGEVNYGNVINLDITYPFGLFKVNGNSDDRWIQVFTKVGSGSLFEFNGLTESFSARIPENTFLYNVSGNAIESRNNSYVGFGSLFHIGDRVEKATFSYNSSSVSDYDELDYGLITASGLTNDYGLITKVSSGGEIDYGAIINLDITYPFGLFKVSGNSDDRWIQVFTKIGSGSLFEFTGATEAFSAQTPENTFLYNVSGNAIESRNNSYVGFGSLFEVGDKVERVTYNYNESSIVAYETEVDYGSVTTSGITIDLGYVNQIATDGEIDYGSVTLYDYDYPVNVLFKFTGAAEDQYKPAFAHKGSGRFTIASDRTFVRFRPHWRSVGGLFVDGTLSESRNNSYVASGSLFHIGDRVEKATFSYNSSSVSDYDSFDYGFVTTSGTIIDHGYVTQTATGGEVDLGNVIDLNITYPFGLFKVSGDSDDRWIQVFTKVGSGSLFEFNGLTESFSARIPENTLLYNVSGNANESRNKSYVASGSLFHIGDRIEKRTFSYNSSSVSEYDASDYGLITASGTIIDNGYVTQTATSGEIDYGAIINLDITYPFGLFKVNGNSDDRWIQVFTKVGSGSLFAIGNAAEAFSAQTPENTFLYNVSGNANESRNKSYVASGSLFHIGDRVERRTFSYNTSSEIDAVNEVDYGNLSNSTQNLDNGLITSNADGGEIDYGSVINTIGSEKPFGLFRISGIAVTPFERSYYGSGSLFAIGNAAEAFSAQTPENTFLYTFFGSAITPRTREFIGSGDAVKVTGNVIERHTESYVGYVSLVFEERFPAASEANTESYVGKGNIRLSTGRFPEFRNYRPTPRYVNAIHGNIGGTLNVSGDGITKPIRVYTKVGSGVEFISGYIIEKQTDSWYGTGKINVSGNGDTDRARAYSSTGRFSVLKGVAEAFSAQTPENTFLYTFSGSAVEKNTEKYRGSGSAFSFGTATETILISAAVSTALFKVSGAAIPVISLLHYGSGFLFNYGESTSKVVFNPVENTALYQISGSGTLKKSNKHDGSGQIDITGTLIEKNTENYLGTGNILTVGSSAAAVAFNPTENVQLFNVYGSAIESHTERYISTGSAQISGSAIEKNTENYVGTGNIFSFLQSESKVSFNPSEETILFRFTGSATEKNTENYIGTGSLFAFNETSESVVFAISANVQLFRFSGSAIEKNTENYVGTGNIFTVGEKIESRTVIEKASGNINLTGYIQEKYSKAPYQGSGSLFAFQGAAESKTSNPPEEAALFKFTGSAVEKNTENYKGSGNATISGNVAAKFTRSYVGKGNISFGTNTAVIAFVAQTPENTILFRFNGESKFKYISRYPGSGTEFISGIGIEKQTDSYRGKGSLFGIGNASINRLVVEETDTRTSLFRISGIERNSYSRISVTNKFNIEISGASKDIVILFSPARIFGSII